MLSVINSDPPRDTHMVAIVPVEAILVAVGLDAVMRFLFERPFRFNRAAGMAVAGTMLLSVMLTGLRDYFVSMPQYYPPDIRSVIDFYDLQLQTPRDVVYVTNDPNQYDFAPFLTLYLANKAHFRLVRLDAIASTGVLPSGQDTTWFFEPTVAKEVINYLTVTLHQNNIQPKVYRHINGSAFLISYEFQSSSHS